jgi:tetratricopeptide (TPR) repeat protein
MATRWLDALSRHRRDDAGTLRAVDLLLEHAERPVEIATLSTRGAEAAFRAGLADRARGYLEKALEADPQHPTALASLAELRRHLGDHRGAAETIETMAQSAAVPEHRLEDWHAAAAIWLDRADDRVRGRAALERAAEIDLGYADVFDRLVTLAREGQENEVIADLYARRLGQIEDLDARAQLQVDYAQVLVDLGDRDGARAAIAAALDAMPGQLDALQAGVKLAEEAEEWGELERYLSQLADVYEEPTQRVGVWRRLGAVYAGPLPNPRGAESVYRKILDETPDDDEILGRLVDVYVELGDADQAVETHQERVRLATEPATRRKRLIQLAQLLDEVAGEPERALRALEQARASDPADLDALTALAEFHGKHGTPEAVAPAMDAAIADLRRRIGEDPGDRHLFAQLARILELRGRDDAARIVHAALAGLSGEPSPLVGAEDAAAMGELDPYVCPPELSPELRALLAKAGEALEKSVPVDLRALKAAKLGTSNPVLKAKIDAVARGFALPDPDIVISRAMPFLCLPVGSKPFQIVIGDGMCASEDDTARRFALARTMKLCGAHCAALIRVPAPDLRTYVDALLHHLHLSHPPPAIEAERLDEITKRLQRFIPRKEEPEMKTMASTVVGQGVPSVEVLASAAATWGDRVGLLAIGDLGAALRGVAWTLGHKDLPLGDEGALRTWLRDNPAARDLVAFAVSDAYVEARKRCGV